ncbi:DNA-directed RNA polymerase I subunit RPA43 [Aspergillus candidus]|uniref:DNA-directed RNA polymerase subunit n=1 Tax=Aspergillus candidus TaxID=41067 RepID=A0A2I2FAP6_ASPCN|nr:hypothetical protein BDW47DRAFT_106650 [Aspergillus candidus]PLB37700.1 hypothetical protein BDW47DRAFT_106650 [Aspergillus candidus]
MATDTMDIDTHREVNLEKERKRKHKNRDDPSTSKKKRKHESSLVADESSAKADKKSSKKSKSKEKSSSSSSKKHGVAASAAAPSATSPYVLTTATMYLPLSPISISPTHALASLCAEHLSPLLLTYYAPLQGIVLAYSNTSISSSPPSSSTPSEPADPSPQPLTLATTAGEYGVLYVYLTATFLVFRPQRGQILEGWVNVQSEGFLGAVVLNLFSVGIERKRLPSNWKWVPPGEEYEEGEESTGTAEPQKDKPAAATTSEDEDSEPSAAFDAEKEHFNPVTLASDSNPLADEMMTEENGDAAGAGADDDAAAEGYFQSVSGHRVRGTVRFRVVDIDIIPGSERDHGFMSIEGTMLTPEEEAKVLEDERNGILSTTSSMTPSRAATPSMTGAITAVDFNPPPEESPSKEAKPVKEKKSKSKKKDKER